MPESAPRLVPLPLKDESAFRRASRQVQLYGVMGVSKLTAAKVVRGLLRRESTDDYTLWRDRLFDRQTNVRTAEPVPTSQLQTPDSARESLADAVEYRPTSAADAAGMIDRLPIDAADYHFVDLGCGKGRVLLLAAAMPFRGVTGVEFSPELADEARQNLRDCRLPRRAAAADVVTGDAATYAFPDGPLVVYLFNPFGERLLREVAANLVASLEKDRRDCWVVYANALHADVFAEDVRWQPADTHDPWWAIFRWRPERD